MDAKRQKPQLRLQWREIIVGLKKEATSEIARGHEIATDCCFNTKIFLTYYCYYFNLLRI